MVQKNKKSRNIPDIPGLEFGNKKLLKTSQKKLYPVIENL
jgi:hypothetical protein